MSPLSLFGRALPIAFLAGLAPISSAQTLWFVDASAAPGGDGKNWNEAFDSLQSALDVGLEGDQIWVVAGVYRPTKEQSVGNPRSVTFFYEHRVQLFGGFQGTETSIDERDPGLFELTVLSGDIGVPGDPTDNAYHVLRMGSFSIPAAILPELNGFRVTAGNANGRGGGLLIGLDGQGYTPAIALTDCVFDGNDANEGGAIATVDFGLVHMKRCRVEGNSALNNGGAVWARTGSLRAANCTFTDNTAQNRGGALWANSTTGGMISYSNCLFAGNWAVVSGGAAHMAGASFTSGVGSWFNCTVVDNRAGTSGGAFHVNTNSTIEGRANLYNTIVWANDAPQDPQIHGRGLTVIYCDVEGGYAGAGNIDADPLFRGVPGAEYEPRPGSPVNDAGDNGLIISDILDLDEDGNLTEPTPIDLNGRPRRLADPLAPETGSGGYPLVDMGAFESSLFSRAN